MNTEVSAIWKPGFESFHKADAQKVAEEITSIGENATPAQIVDKSRDPNTELHKCFDWDVQRAAEAHWRDQARLVARHLVIRETVRESSPPIRFFAQTENGKGYQPARLIVRNPDSYQALLASALRDLEAFRRKYHSLTELEAIFDDIADLMRGKAS